MKYERPTLSTGLRVKRGTAQWRTPRKAPGREQRTIEVAEQRGCGSANCVASTGGKNPRKGGERFVGILSARCAAGNIASLMCPIRIHRVRRHSPGALAGRTTS